MRLDHKLSRIQIDSFEISGDELVFQYFKSLPEQERDSALFRAIKIGVLAQMEDRFSSFLSKTSDELGVQLESLKKIFDLKQEVFHKTAIKGIAAENDICDFLAAYIQNRSFNDVVHLTGTERGTLRNNKTGDIVAFVDEDPSKAIAIECKFDKSIKLGSVDSNDIASNKYDTAWSQLLEASVNRSAAISIIVFDKSLADSSILKAVDGVAYLDNIGFVCVIDYLAGDYQNLAIAYSFSRGLASGKNNKTVEPDFVNFLVQRLIRDIKDITSITSLVESNIRNNQQILKNVEKAQLSIDFTRAYLEKYLTDGMISKSDLLDFYQRDEARLKYKMIAQDIENDFKVSTSDR
jgi:hypothetical protein